MAAATMDFFASQDAARRRTSLLVFYYAVAVALIVLAVNLAFALVLGSGGGAEDARPPRLFAHVSLGTLGVILAGTLYKISQLSAGGEAVARLLGGRLVPPNTRDPRERRALNVVEEMAIASGTPVPPVYLLDAEEGINAFAAGYTPQDAVIGLTRGAVQKLRRAELQGVVGHEFSHILNGDMRLNLRLVGVLGGILVIATVGYWLLRSGHYSRPRRGKGGGNPLPLLGLLLMVIGYIGVFFGRLIQSAVSREREFLADASAVQFTRDPSGLADALKRIGASPAGSQVQSPNAPEVGHLLFASGLQSAWLNLFATHPPLAERIRRLDPAFEGAFEEPAERADSEPAPPPLASPAAAAFAAEPAAIADRVGAPRAEHLAFAAGLVAGLPEALRKAARDPFSAQAVVCGLLLSSTGAVRAVQRRKIGQQAEAALAGELDRLLPMLAALKPAARLPVAEMAAPALRGLSTTQYGVFRLLVRDLVAADQELDLFELALERMLTRRLDVAFGLARRPAAGREELPALTPACIDLLSCVAYWGADDQAQARAAFDRAWRQLGAGATPGLRASDACGLGVVSDSLDTLQAAAPQPKRKIVEACAACVAHDGRVTAEEAELLRAIAETLDCPLPPFLS